MSGHSKWSNIKHKKGAADAQRGAIFTKIGREIQVAVKNGGPDPESNSRLKDAIAKAKANNMPNDNVQRSIKKASGLNDTENYEEILYEGYGPGGIAVMVRTLTDNRNRTAGDIRHLFDKFGGNMGTNGCVSFQFEEKGVLILDREEFPEIDEETIMMAALEVGAEDISVNDDSFEIIVLPENYQQVKQQMIEQGYVFADMSLGPVPTVWAKVDDLEIIEKMKKMVEKMEELDDVQEVIHNWECD